MTHGALESGNTQEDKSIKFQTGDQTNTQS